MDSLKKLLYNQVKENCRTELQKKWFLDWVSFDYMTLYDATNECEIDFSQALYDAIYNSMDDSTIEITVNTLFESGLQETVLSHRK